MESEPSHALSLRMRQLTFPVGVAFLVACASSAVWLLSGQPPLSWFPAGGVPVAFLAAALVFMIAGAYVCRATPWFNTLPVLPLRSLQRALHVAAAVTCAALFVGSLELHGWHSGGDEGAAAGGSVFNLRLSSRSPATLAQLEGWGRWVLCSMPLFLAYMLHDVHSPAAPAVWWALSAAAITSSHVINGFLLVEPTTVAGAAPLPALSSPSHFDWLLVLFLQLLYLTLNYLFAAAAVASIQSHRAQLLHRESAMVEQGKCLALQREHAVSTAHVKSQFLAMMSHEMRTPLNGVIGLCQLVLESELTADQRDCLNTVIKSGETLLCVINDCLLMCGGGGDKDKGSKLLIESQPFSPINAVEDALDIFTLQAQQQDIQLVPHFKPYIPCPAWGDAMRIRQILTNLISNALKFSKRSGEVIVTVEPIEEPYEAIAEAAAAAAREAEADEGIRLYPTPVPSPSPKGTPRVSPRTATRSISGSVAPSPPSASARSTARRPHHPQKHYPRRPDAPDTGVIYLKFSVQDFGCGIPRNKQHYLFHAFSQVDTSDTRRHGGTGLGLVIVKRLVELMHGQIGFQSEAGQGSTFWFWLPCPTRPPPAETAAEEMDVLEMYAIPERLEQLANMQAQPDYSPHAVDEPAGVNRRKPSLSIDLGAVATPLANTELHQATTMAAAAEAQSTAAASASASTSAAADGPSTAPPSNTLMSPSLSLDPSQTFSRSVARLAGKRLLLVESSTRCADALGELARLWGMQVTIVHTKAAWEAEWHNICLHAYRKHQTRSIIATTPIHPLTASTLLAAAEPPASAAKPCMEASASAVRAAMDEAAAGSGIHVDVMPACPGLVEREGSAATAVAAAADAQNGPLYDVVLILDSLLADDTFVPYAAYNAVAREKDFAGMLRAAGEPLGSPPPSAMPSLLLGDNAVGVSDDASVRSQQLHASTCTTASSSQQCTPASFTRGLSAAMGGDGRDGSISMGGVSAEEFGMVSLPPSIGRRRSRTVASSPQFVASSTMSMPSALSLALGGGTPTSSSAMPPLPVFVLLLSSSRHKARLDAAKEAATRGIASVLPKPVKWKALLQALLKASNYKPSPVTLLKAFQSSFSPAQSSPSQMFRSPGPPSAHRRSITSLPVAEGQEGTRSAGSRRNTSCDMLSPVRAQHPQAESTPSSAQPTFETEQSEQSGLTVAPQRRSMSLDGESAAHLPPKHLLSTRSVASTASGSSPLFSPDSVELAAPAAIAEGATSSSSSGWNYVRNHIRGHHSSSNGISGGTVLQQLQLAREVSGPKSEAYGGLPVHTPQSAVPALGSPQLHPGVATPNSATLTPTRPRRATLPHGKAGAPLLGGAGASPSRVSPNATLAIPPNAHLRILVAEDNKTNQKIVIRMLNHLGYHDVTVANDGVECLQAMARHNQHQSALLQPSNSRQSSSAQAHPATVAARPFDLILMDKSMPRLGGLSATRRIRAGLCPCFQPRIVALTANVLPADQEACAEAGMQDFIPKPLMVTPLKQVLLQCKVIGADCNHDSRPGQQQQQQQQRAVESRDSSAPELPPPPPSYLLRQSSMQPLLASPTQLLSPDSGMSAMASPAFSELASPGPLSACSSSSSSFSASLGTSWPAVSPPGPPPPSCVCCVLWSDAEQEEQEE